MTPGIEITLSELIALQALVKRQHSPATRCHVPGKNMSRARGRGMDITDIRHYQAGDEIRHMEWRITARTGKPHVKLYTEERERPVMICADFSPSMYFGTRGAFKSFVAARLAGLLTWTAIKHGDKVGGVLFSAHTRDDFLPSLHQQNVAPFLASLAHFTKRARVSNDIPHEEAREKAFYRLQQLAKPGSLLIIISDFYQEPTGYEAQLARLKARHEVISFQVCDALELMPPPAGLYPISDGLHTHWLDVRDKKSRQAYQTHCEQHLQRIKEPFSKLNIPLHQVTAATALEHFVAETFLRRGHASRA